MSVQGSTVNKQIRLFRNMTVGTGTEIFETLKPNYCNLPMQDKTEGEFFLQRRRTSSAGSVKYTRMCVCAFIVLWYNGKNKSFD